MEISYILTFLSGIAADIARKVFVPQTEEWLEKFVPYKRRARNLERNLLQLEVRERLAKMGHDPDLARFVEEDAEDFWQRLDRRQEALRETVIEITTDRVLSPSATQAEMNHFAFDQLKEAEKILADAVERLQRKAGLSEKALASFDAAQHAWETYRDAQSEFEGLAVAEDGSMQASVQAWHAKEMTNDRILDIAALRKGLTHYEFE